jgi:branched-chain amino acid aminotransferase
MPHKYCFLNGKIIETAKASLPINDISILRGFGVFDFFRIYSGQPFFFEDHFDRFVNSAKSLGLKIPYSKKELLITIQKLVNKNTNESKNQNFHVRMVLTGGPVKNGLEPSKPNLLILFEYFKDYPKSYFEKGQKIITFEHQRFLPQSKTTNYMQAVMLQPLKKKAQAIEILYVNKGIVTECTTSNIFFIKNGVLYTPIDDILQGITKKIVIDLANKLNIQVISKIVSLKDLYDADEVFLTATNKKVLPIVQINDILIGAGDKKGKSGQISLKLLESYNNLLKNN